MDSVVVDTDVVSFAAKQDERFAYYQPRLVGKVLVLSFMTVAELKYWALSRNWGLARQQKLREYLDNHFVVHPYDRELCTQWAKLTHSAQRQGRVLHCADAWIAATAKIRNAPWSPTMASILKT